MRNPLHAAYYADQAVQRTVAVRENVALAPLIFRLRFDCPELAQRIVPGQFVMVRLSGCDDPLIGRPLALYDTVLDRQGEPTGLDVVYLVKGKMTTRLADYQPGQLLDVWGPLGNGFSPRATDHLVMVAGGIGQTPFLALAQEYLGRRRYGLPPRVVAPADRVTLCFGARTRSLLGGMEDFVAVGVDVHACTDDGSFGAHGLVSEVVERVLEDQRTSSGKDRIRIVCCGPEPMMEAVAGICQRRGLACEVSLETPMACGVGICFTCVARVLDEDGQWDYKRTCVEGPVFDAERLVW